MTQPPHKSRRWLLAVDPRVYHWDTLFVKGKEMWRHAGHRPDAIRQLKKMVMDLRAIERLPRQVTLAELRENKLLRKIKFLKNTRLTVCPLTDEEYSEILRMAGIVASPGIPLP
jgi:predicted RNA-binding protein with PUA-like domain